MQSNQIGSISETAVELDLLNRGYNVLFPSVPTRYDRLVEIAENDYLRVQVKTARMDKRDGNLRVSYDFPYDKSQIDLIAVYDPTGEQIYYVPIEEIHVGAKGFTLRLHKRKNKRKTHGLMAVDYTNFPVGG